MDPRRLPDATLLAAVAASAALAALLLLAPGFPLRAPLALLGGAWAPGYALVAAVWPPGALSRLERHALAFGAGLLALPLLGLAVSVTVGFRAEAVAVGALLLTLALAVVAAFRHGAADPPTWGRLPSTRATLAISGGAFGVAILLTLPALVPAAPAPHGLALAGPDGLVPSLELAQGEPASVVVEARAGGDAADGRLVVTLDGAVVADRRVALPPHGVQEVAVTIPASEPGSRHLVATWAGREVHATFRVVPK